MANAVKWSTPASIASVMTTELNSLASGSKAVASSAVDNATDKNRYADFELNVTFGSSPSAGGYVLLYLIPSLDGTNFADGDASTDPQSHLEVGAFQVRATTNAQKLHLRDVKLPPFKFKPLLVNNTSQSFPASGSTLKTRAYNEEVQ